MNSKHNFFLRMFLAIVILLINFGSMPGTVFAEEGDEGIDITVAYEILPCGDVEFTIAMDNITSSYDLVIDYGDGGPPESITSDSDEVTLIHTYYDHGVYEFTINVTETNEGGLTGLATGEITIDNPAVAVTLTSEPSPPLIVQGVDDPTVTFFATVTGGDLNYTYAWDLNGDGVDEADNGDTAFFSYTETGKYPAQIMVTDGGGCIATDTLSVVVTNPGDVCHPAAQKIADAVNSIFPNQADDLYTCEEIYDIFDGSLTGSQIGFGRMWKAYNLALTMEELTWEDILDWHLDAGGWGALLQLDRFSELLETHSLGDLMALVLSEEYSLGDVRLAVRSVTRYEADLEDALARIAEGANPGELTQLYKLAGDLEVDPTLLDEYMADGLTLSELKHTANIADRMEVEWAEVADARAAGDSWGDLNQAYRLADEETTALEILVMGVKEYKEDLREQDKEDREDQQAEKQEEKNQQTGEKFAEQFSAEFGDVMNLFNGECKEDWACVRETLREQTREQAEGFSEKDTQTTLQIASKYGFTEEEVLAYHKDYCGEDWTCTRAYFREQYMETKETGKPDK